MLKSTVIQSAGDNGRGASLHLRLPELRRELFDRAREDSRGPGPFQLPPVRQGDGLSVARRGAGLQFPEAGESAPEPAPAPRRSSPSPSRRRLPRPRRLLRAPGSTAPSRALAPEPPLRGSARGQGRAGRAGRREALRGGREGIRERLLRPARDEQTDSHRRAQRVRPGSFGRRRRRPRRRAAGAQVPLRAAQDRPDDAAAVCRKHTDVVAHYQCKDSGRPLCDECAPEKKFGGTSVRVCDHCGGNVRDLHAAPGDLS